MGTRKCGEKKGTANDPKHTSSSEKHGGGVVIAWACMTVSETDPLNFTDDLIYDNSSRMNLEGDKTILPTNIQENTTRFIRKCFILHRTMTKTPCQFSQGVYKSKKWKVLYCPSQSPDLNMIEHEFHQLKSKGRNNWNWLH